MPSASSYPTRRHPRLPGYNYTTPGHYFITLCVQQRLVLFGGITDGDIRPTTAGQMVGDAWNEVCDRCQDVQVDTMLVMPDHVHAIVVLNDDPARTLSLSQVVQRYKSLTTKRYSHGVRDHGWQCYAGKLWQESFYDHVIRTEEELNRIRRYISENPLRWAMRHTGT